MTTCNIPLIVYYIKGLKPWLTALNDGILKVLDEDETIHYKKRRLMRLSYNGITSAFQAEEAGSTPVGRSREALRWGAFRVLVRSAHAGTLR